MSRKLKVINFISPSSLYYWEKCPLRAVFADSYRGIRTFPAHPDSALGSLIHSFYENKVNWEINDNDSFEKKWAEEIKKINKQYLIDVLQSVFYPIEWHSKFFAVKKIQLRQSIIKNQYNYDSTKDNVSFEKWLDDDVDIGGKIDFIRYNKRGEIIEVVDFKTGGIFEIVENKKKIKTSYRYQLALYAYLVSLNQSFIPKCYIQNNRGEKFEIDIDFAEIQLIYRKAIDLKAKVNTSIIDNQFNELACPSAENCGFCNYRPFCNIYKQTMINDFSNKMVDVFGKIERIFDLGNFVVSIPGKVLTLKNIISVNDVKEGDMVYIYNLFCPDHEHHILFATKGTIIKYE